MYCKCTLYSNRETIDLDTLTIFIVCGMNGKFLGFSKFRWRFQFVSIPVGMCQIKKKSLFRQLSTENSISIFFPFFQLPNFWEGKVCIPILGEGWWAFKNFMKKPGHFRVQWTGVLRSGGNFSGENIASLRPQPPPPSAIFTLCLGAVTNPQH